jgi:hypothetical protein
VTDRRKYWQERLASQDLRAGWYVDLEGLGFFSGLVSFDAAGRLDEQQTLVRVYRREAAVEALDEAVRLVPGLVAATILENLGLVAADKEKAEE